MMAATQVAVHVLAQTPAPTQDVEYPDPVLVTPGTIGFLFTFFVAVAMVFLVRDAIRRVRRVRAADHAVQRYPIPLRRPDSPDNDHRPASTGDMVETSAADPGISETVDGGTDDPGAESSGADDPDTHRPDSQRPDTGTEGGAVPEHPGR